MDTYGRRHDDEDMPSEIHELVRALGRIEGKMDGFLADGLRRERQAAITDAKVSNLEQRVSRLIGWAAGAGAVAAAVTSFLIKVIV